ncbi:hypothetical protein F2Q68_00016075, partial [Brassica cretica]
VSPAQYRFIRPESGLELSQRRDRNLYGSGVPKSTPFQPYSERSFFKWLTGVTWKDAGKVRLFFLSLPEKSFNFALCLVFEILNEIPKFSGGAGRWIVVLSAATTVLHLDVDTDQCVSDWLHRVPTQCRA